MITPHAYRHLLSGYNKRGLLTLCDVLIKPTRVQWDIYNAYVKCAYEHFGTIADEAIVAHGFIEDDDHNITFAVITESVCSQWLYISGDGGFTYEMVERLGSSNKMH